MIKNYIKAEHPELAPFLSEIRDCLKKPAYIAEHLLMSKTGMSRTTAENLIYIEKEMKGDGRPHRREAPTETEEEVTDPWNF